MQTFFFSSFVSVLEGTPAARLPTAQRGLCSGHGWLRASPARAQWGTKWWPATPLSAGKKDSAIWPVDTAPLSLRPLLGCLLPPNHGHRIPFLGPSLRAPSHPSLLVSTLGTWPLPQGPNLSVLFALFPINDHPLFLKVHLSPRKPSMFPKFSHLRSCPCPIRLPTFSSLSSRKLPAPA